MNQLKRIAAEKRQLMLPLGIVAIATVLLYAIVLFPLRRQVLNNEEQARVSRETLRLAREDYAAARATVEGKSQADAQLQRFYHDVLPANQAAARHLTLQRLYQIARDANVRLDHGSAQPEHEKGSPLAKLNSAYVLSGDYRDVRKFIYALETSPDFLVLERVSLTSDQQRDKSGLTVGLQVATYYRAGDAD